MHYFQLVNNFSLSTQTKPKLEISLGFSYNIFIYFSFIIKKCFLYKNSRFSALISTSIFQLAAKATFTNVQLF